MDDIRVKGIGKSFDALRETAHSEHDKMLEAHKGKLPRASKALKQATHRSVYFEQTGRNDVPIVRLRDVEAGSGLSGPIILVDETQTIVVEPECEAHFCSRTVVLNILYDKSQAAVA